MKKIKKVKKPKFDKRDIELCLSRFDFDRVRITMEALEWGWTKGSIDLTATEVPSVDELMSAARDLLSKCVNSGVQYSSGGFTAKIEDDILVLMFVVEESDSLVD